MRNGSISFRLALALCALESLAAAQLPSPCDDGLGKTVSELKARTIEIGGNGDPRFPKSFKCSVYETVLVKDDTGPAPRPERKVRMIFVPFGDPISNDETRRGVAPPMPDSGKHPEWWPGLEYTLAEDAAIHETRLALQRGVAIIEVTRDPAAADRPIGINPVPFKLILRSRTVAAGSAGTRLALMTLRAKDGAPGMGGDPIIWDRLYNLSPAPEAGPPSHTGFAQLCTRPAEKSIAEERSYVARRTFVNEYLSAPVGIGGLNKLFAADLDAIADQVNAELDGATAGSAQPDRQAPAK